MGRIGNRLRLQHIRLLATHGEHLGWVDQHNGIRSVPIPAVRANAKRLVRPPDRRSGRLGRILGRMEQFDPPRRELRPQVQCLAIGGRRELRDPLGCVRLRPRNRITPLSVQRIELERDQYRLLLGDTPLVLRRRDRGNNDDRPRRHHGRNPV